MPGAFCSPCPLAPLRDADPRHPQLIDALVSCGVSQAAIGVISPYRQQIKLLSRSLAHVPAVEVLTADRSQGRDKDCIVMSLIRSNSDGQVRPFFLFQYFHPLTEMK